MSTIAHQHENERVLYRTRRSKGALLIALGRSFVQGIIGGAFLFFLASGAWYLVIDEMLITVFAAIPFLIVFLLTVRRWMIWKETVFTITSKRILYHHYVTLLKSVSEAIQWSRYQDSSYESSSLGTLLNSGTLKIHYGTADAGKVLTVNGLPWASDLKHYLDKIQSLRSIGTEDLNLPLFVRAKKGKRDRPVLSYVE